MTRLKFLAMAFLAAMLSAPAFAQAQYPDRPLRAIVAFGTGGATDVIARVIATSMVQSLGQPVVIENRPGADGIVAGELRDRCRPRGARGKRHACRELRVHIHARRRELPVRAVRARRREYGYRHRFTRHASAG